MRAAAGSPRCQAVGRDGCSENRAPRSARRQPATTNPNGIAHHGSVRSGTKFSRELRYRRNQSEHRFRAECRRLRLRRRAASSSPINPSRVRTPSRPSGCTGGVSLSESATRRRANRHRSTTPFIGSTRRGLASMKCGVFVCVIPDVVERQCAVPLKRLSDPFDGFANPGR